MTYVVTEACIGNKHTNCVDVCPVEAFREGPDMLFIDPEVCIDCNACVTECPERAIYPKSAVPAGQERFIALNAREAEVRPVIRESLNREAAAGSGTKVEARCAVVGSGPSGFYAAEALLKQLPNARVDMFERLPTPFGLVRYGVAPDHPGIKSVTGSYERIAESPRFRFFGNVEIGRDLQGSELLEHYHTVIYATGGSQSRALEIPGIERNNVFGSSEFVGWYNGHPDHQALSVDTSPRSAVVIGMGNVALDIARMLVLESGQLAKTDIADDALAALADSNITQVCLVARRGPVQAAFTPKELEQLIALPDVDLVVEPDDLNLDAASEAQLARADSTEARQNLELLRSIAERGRGGSKRIRFVFNVSPVEIGVDADQQQCLNLVRNRLEDDGQGRVVARATDESFTVPAGLVVHATGYQGQAVDGLAFDARRGVIQNRDGRALGDDAEPSTKEFVTGWIKRGASGVIGSNKHCANETVDQLLEQLPEAPAAIEVDVQALLDSRKVDYVSFADWRLLDAHEQSLGKSEGRPRRKITDVSTMLQVIRDARAEAERERSAQADLPVKTHFRSCPLCEAMCGVKIEYQGDRILSVAGDPDDPHSEGHICPKGYALQDLHNNPDRLKTPLEKVDGEWREIDWDTALDKVAQRLVEIQSRHGNSAVGGYWGNPASHNLGLLMGSPALRKTLGSGNMFTAASLDQMPHQLVSYLMFGHSNLFTIPDIDRTDYMLMLGANPAASNGSLMTAGDILKRLEAIQERGGKVVLVDPRRTESARYMSEHLFIRPSTDALFLIGLIQHIIDQRLYDPDHLAPLLDGWDELLALFDEFSLAEISQQCGIEVEEIKRIAEAFAGAERAVCYGRMGVSTQRFGALNHWLMLVLNILTGNLDRAGGMMFTTPAFDKSLKRPMGSFGTYRSRVRGLPEFERTLPTAVMAEEMLTPGEGQIRAFLCVAGNPVLSSPNGRQMDRALEQLDFMVSIDFYLNETSRHADIILPPTGPLEHEQYDLVFNLLAVRNLARFSEALFQPPEGARSDWDIVQGLTSRIAALKYPDAEQPGRAPSPAAILDHGLRTGPYGEGFTEYNSGAPVAHDEGLSLDVLKRYPHGLDLGPMQPNFPRYLFTDNGKIQAAPEPLVHDLKRLSEEFGGAGADAPLTLIGRRDLRSNNSWMHNSQRLIKGRNRCALYVHPDDAARLGLHDQGRARISSSAGELEVTVGLSDDIMPGVVSLPHGWGHGRDGVQLAVAQSKPGVSINDITDDQAVDALSGNAVLNGIAVRVEPVHEARQPADRSLEREPG